MWSYLFKNHKVKTNEQSFEFPVLFLNMTFDSLSFCDSQELISNDIQPLKLAVLFRNAIKEVTKMLYFQEKVISFAMFSAFW